MSNRCARGLFLLEPEATSEPDGHRKQLLLARLEALVAVMSIEVLAYSVMGNHLHLVLRSVPEAGHGWSADQVVTRWLTLHPLRNRQGLREAEPGELEALKADEGFVASTRRKLMDLSQFMKELKQHVAVEVNKLEGGSGAFWAGRYKSKSIDDPQGHQLVRSMVYVDLNPLAAGLCDTPEEGRHTSLEARLGQRQGLELPLGLAANPPGRVPGRSWLVGFADTAAARRHVACPSSSRVVLTGLTLRRYLRVVDAVARLMRAGKASLDRRLAPILQRVGLVEDDLSAGFARMAAGSPHF